MFEILLIVTAALALDYLIGEPTRFHPLVGFGNFASFIEKRLNRKNDNAEYAASKSTGILAWLLVVLPFLVLAVVLEIYAGTLHWLYPTLGMFVLYLAIGRQSLVEHALAIAEPLSHYETADLADEKDDALITARLAVGMIVSRDTKELEPQDVASAATESVLENGADAVFSAIFWFCIAGIPGVVLYRLSNTLDAMWGYKNTRFLQFGWAAARIDDVLNYLPARLTALSYALAGKTSVALRCWRDQAPQWKSPNAGPVMAAGAGALGVKLGGDAIYHGHSQTRPDLGAGEQPSARSIEKAVSLVNRTAAIWLVVLALLAIMASLI